jgi:hypothetical protein
MTNLQIKMLLHYRAIAEPYALHDPAHANSPAVLEQREWLVQAQMLRRTTDTIGYAVTERGAVWLDHVYDLPLPTQKWSMT